MQEQRHINDASELISPNCVLLCTSAEIKFTDYLAGCKKIFFSGLEDEDDDEEDMGDDELDKLVSTYTLVLYTHPWHFKCHF